MSTELQREMQTMDSLVALYGDEGDKADWQRIRASLTPAREAAAAAVPEGYKVVPVEPTQGMLDAAGMSIVPDGKEWLDQSNRETWAAMLAAAPARKPAAAVPGYNEDEIADACMMAEVSDSKYVTIIAYLADNRRALLAAANKENNNGNS